MYFAFNPARTESVVLISEHQQPPSVAPQTNGPPQASQVEGSRKRGEITPRTRKSGEGIAPESVALTLEWFHPLGCH